MRARVTGITIADVTVKMKGCEQEVERASAQAPYEELRGTESLRKNLPSFVNLGGATSFVFAASRKACQTAQLKRSVRQKRKFQTGK